MLTEPDSAPLRASTRQLLGWLADRFFNCQPCNASLCKLGKVFWQIMCEPVQVLLAWDSAERCQNIDGDVGPRQACEYKGSFGLNLTPDRADRAGPGAVDVGATPEIRRSDFYSCGVHGRSLASVVLHAFYHVMAMFCPHVPKALGSTRSKFSEFWFLHISTFSLSFFHSLMIA